MSKSKKVSQKGITMPTIINNVENKNGVMTFVVQNTNRSVANALRRTILSDIEVVCLKTDPYKENLIKFVKNTTRLNNEITKHRLSCIPVHIKKYTDDLKDLIVEVKEVNDTDAMKYITSGDIKIKNIVSNKYLSDAAVKKIFPPNSLTKDYILFSRLRPKVSDLIPGEELHLECKFSVSTALEDGMFNVAATCAYGNSPDVVAQNNRWDEISDDLEKSGASVSKIAYERDNWFNHGSKRVYKENSFDFTLESVGVYTNNEIMMLACASIVDRNNKLYQLFNSENVLIKNNTTTVDNCYDVYLEGIDYTIGKVIEYILHYEYFENQKVLSYVGFLKRHPHDTNSIIRIAFTNKNKSNVENINEIFKHSLEISNKIFKNVSEYF